MILTQTINKSIVILDFEVLYRFEVLNLYLLEGNKFHHKFFLPRIKSARELPAFRHKRIPNRLGAIQLNIDLPFVMIFDKVFNYIALALEVLDLRIF